jgi:CBS-domain-containing membrane protein
MEMKRAGDFMIPLDEYPHVPYWFSLRQVIAVLEKSQFDIQGRKSLPRFLLVFDEAYQLLGVARRRDILRGLEPSFLSGQSVDYRKKLFEVKVDPNLSEFSYDKLVGELREKAERPVKEVMRPITKSVDYEDHLTKVIYEMVENNLSLLPVLKEGKVVGVVRSVEVLHEVAQVVL